MDWALRPQKASASIEQIGLGQRDCLHNRNYCGTIDGMKTVSEQLREAVQQCGMTRYAISKETGIAPSVLSRFVASGRGLRSENFDRLCAFLGMVLVNKPGKARKGR
jgi:hypothetical protein